MASLCVPTHGHIRAQGSSTAVLKEGEKLVLCSSYKEERKICEFIIYQVHLVAAPASCPGDEDSTDPMERWAWRQHRVPARDRDRQSKD